MRDDVDPVAFLSFEVQPAPDHEPNPLTRNRAPVFFAKARDEGRRDFSYRQFGLFPPQISDHLEELRFDVHAAIGDDLPMAFARDLPELSPDGRIADDADEGRKDLIEPGLERRVHESRGHNRL